MVNLKNLRRANAPVFLRKDSVVVYPRTIIIIRGKQKNSSLEIIPF